jgi:hypothetical protein
MAKQSRLKKTVAHHEEPPQGGVSNGDFAQDEVSR